MSNSKAWGYRIHDAAAEFRFELEGIPAAEDVAELEQCWRTAASTIAGKAFIVDLNGLAGIDEAGRQLLHRWREAGAEFVATRQPAQTIAESVTGQPAASRAMTAGCGWPTLQSVLRISITMIGLLLLASVWASPK